MTARRRHAIATFIQRAPIVVMPVHSFPAAGGLPKIALAAADGARVEAYLHGAHVTSWHPAGDDRDRLFVSALAHFAPASSDPRRRARVLSAVRRPGTAADARLRAHGAWTLVARGPPARRRGRTRACVSPIRPRRARSGRTRSRASSTVTRERRHARRRAGGDQHGRGRVRVHRRAAHVPARTPTYARSRVRGLVRRALSRQGAAPRRRRGRRTRARRRPAARPRVPRDARASRVREPRRAPARARTTAFTDTVVWNPGPPTDPTHAGADLTPRRAGGSSCASRPRSRARTHHARAGASAGSGSPDADCARGHP